MYYTVRFMHLRVRCSVLQCVAVCCSAFYASAWIHQIRIQCWPIEGYIMTGPRHVSVCCSVLQCVAVCCSVLQCGAVCCSVLQCVAVCCSVWCLCQTCPRHALKVSFHMYSRSLGRSLFIYIGLFVSLFSKDQLLATCGTRVSIHVCVHIYIHIYKYISVYI